MVDDIVAVRDELVDRGVGVSSIRHKDIDGGQWRGRFRLGVDRRQHRLRQLRRLQRSRRQHLGASGKGPPGWLSAPSVLVFDVNETLIDITSLEPLFERMFGDRGVLREWFNQLVLYSMTVTLSEHLHGLLLPRTGGAADDRRHAPRVAHRGRSRRTRSRLAHDARSRRSRRRPETLAAKGYRLVTLTNSPPKPGVPTPLEHAGLAHFFDRQFSVDRLRVFKPSRQLYTGVAEQLEGVAVGLHDGCRARVGQHRCTVGRIRCAR